MICDHTVICGAAFLFHFLFYFLRPGPPIGAAKRWIAIQSRSRKRTKRKCTRAHAFLCSLSFTAAQVQRCLCWRSKWKSKRKAWTSLYIIHRLAIMLLESHASQGWWGRCTRNCGSAKRQLPGSYFFIVRVNAWARMLFPQSFFFFFLLSRLNTSLTIGRESKKEKKEESAALLSNDMKAAYKFLFIFHHSLDCT